MPSLAFLHSRAPTVLVASQTGVDEPKNLRWSGPIYPNKSDWDCSKLSDNVISDMGKRREVILDVPKEQMTSQQLAEKYRIHPKLITK